jgi:hypothetical protein
MRPETKADGDKLWIGDVSVTLPALIDEVLFAGDLIVVRTAEAGLPEPSRNIFGIERGGKIRWQIERSPHGGTVRNPFTGLYISAEGELIAANWIGVDYRVDLSTGKINPWLPPGERRRPW